jgi:alcohol dehydrogenase class IV
VLGPIPADPGEGPAPFVFARGPRILFGEGRATELPAIVRGYGTRALVFVRGSAAADPGAWASIRRAIEKAGVTLAVEHVSGEPSPELVDGIVARIRASGEKPARAARPADAAADATIRAPVDVVVGIGGGSVLDTAKAVAGLLIPGNSVRDHLEGVGPERPYRGPAVPFVAVPTTAGTGSEATKNAVLSSRGKPPFKKSFRDDALVAQVALLDPDLLASCPPALIAGNGMDALTQLIEAYLSIRSNPFTDAIALSGLDAVRDGLPTWHAEAVAGRGADGRGSAAAVARSRMAYAALCSGICLANAGLGAVHGLASPLGAQFPVPHGAACGSVLAATTRANIAALDARAPRSEALARYADVGRVLTGGRRLSDPAARAALVGLLEDWRVRLDVPPLSVFGIGDDDVAAIVADSRGSSMKTNPVVLTDAEVAAIVRASL